MLYALVYWLDSFWTDEYTVYIYVGLPGQFMICLSSIFLVFVMKYWSILLVTVYCVSQLYWYSDPLSTEWKEKSLIVQYNYYTL